MGKNWACLWFVCAGIVCAQTPEAPELARARGEIDRVRALVEAGAAPRLELERAEAQLRDAEDAAFLRTTLYGADLTEAQADDMIAAANRRLERRKPRLIYPSANHLVRWFPGTTRWLMDRLTPGLRPISTLSAP